MRSIAFTLLGLAILSAGCSLTPSARPASQPPSGTAEVALRETGEISQGRGVGRGNGRAGGLPPGIARNLARGKPLPPGIAKQVVPRHVLVELPPAQDGFEYIVVAGKILLIEIATQVVHDILVDVLLD